MINAIKTWMLMAFGPTWLVGDNGSYQWIIGHQLDVHGEGTTTHSHLLQWVAQQVPAAQ